MAVAGAASAGSVLIINGASGTSEAGTTAQITSNLTTLHEEAGNTVTVIDDVPDTITGYSQVWDLRFSNSWAIDADERATYLSFLQGGGGMFVMGENGGFQTRNDSIFALISAAGGGDLSFGTGSATQNVLSPFDGPNPVSQVTFAVPGYLDGPGTGRFITQTPDGTSGVGVAWGVGDLANAAAGALTTIFDVNFMEGDRGEAQQNLTKNLIGFVENEVEPVPLPASLPLLMVGVGAFVALRRRAA